MAGSRVRVAAQLVNIEDGSHLWAQTYDRELTDVFSVQEDIAGAVVEALRVKLVGGPPAGGAATTSREAYAQYLIGRQHYHRLTADGLRRAVEAYERAVALDPGYAPAWAGLALSLYLHPGDGESLAGLAARRRRALEAAEKAVALSPSLPDALSVRALLRSFILNDRTGAKADFERAIAVRPNDPDAHRRYAILLQELGRMSEAVAEARKSVDLDPLGQAWITLGVLHQSSGEYGEAEAAFRRHLTVEPDAYPGLLGLGRTLLLQSRTKEALAVLGRCGDDRVTAWAAAVAEHSLGHDRASREALEEFTRRYGDGAEILVAEAHAWRGETDEAFRWLERAAGDPGSLAAKLRTDPFLAGLHDDPRFAVLIRKLELPPR